MISMQTRMKTKPTTTALATMLTLALLLPAGAALAGTEGRITGQVLDPAGNPLEDVQVVVEGIGVDVQRQAKTSKKGKFTVTVLNASLDYVIRLEKEGFQSIEEPINPTTGGTIKPEYTMVPGETIEQEQLAELQRKDKAAKLYNEGLRQYSLGDPEAGAELFKESLEEDADLGQSHLALALYYLEVKRDAAAALPHAERANALVPEEGMSQMVVFDALWALERYDEALPMLDEMAASGKVAEKVAVRSYNAGVREVKNQDFAGAKYRFEKALELDPSLAGAHLTLGQIAYNSGDLEAALGHANAYTEARPDEARGLRLLYQVHVRMGNEEAATAAFDRMAAAGPEEVVTAFFEAGVEHFNAGSPKLALSSFEKVLRAQPDHAHAHYFVGLCRSSLSDFAGARESFNRFLELAPEHPDAAVAREMLAGLE